MSSAQSAPDLPDVSVVITHHNNPQLLRDCLASIKRETKGVSVEVVVVDDASTDGSPDVVRKEFPWCRLVAQPTNSGFVASNNRGVREARGRYIFLLNNDTILANNALRILTEYLDSHPEAGVCGPLLLAQDGRPQMSYGHFPSLVTALVEVLLLNDLFPRADFAKVGVVPADSDLAESREVDFVSGAALMIRSGFVKTYGLFDEVLEAYFEESDLCYRVRRDAHQSVAFVPSARILHLQGVSYGRLGERRAGIFYRSFRHFLRKHHGRVYAAIFMVIHAFYNLEKLLLRSLRLLVSRGAAREEGKTLVQESIIRIRHSLANT